MAAAMWTPGWVDLSTTGVELVRPFYEGLFGWTSSDTPTPMGPEYTRFFKDGKAVAGMWPQPQAATGSPSSWMTLMFVPDVDAVTGRVPALGGHVLMAPMDVMTEGRMAVVTDPSGAVFGLWQSIDHMGAEVYNQPGSLTWNELQTRDLAAASQFYQDLLGWRWDSDDTGYWIAHVDSKPGDSMAAGAMTMPEGVPAEAPSMWLCYFAVDDCDLAVARAVDLGGRVFVPPMDMGPGRFAGIVDPAGAMFMLGNFPASDPQ